MALVDFVRPFRGGSVSVLSSSDNFPITVGNGITNVAVSMSHVVVYDVVKSISEIQRIGKCTDLVSGNESNTSKSVSLGFPNTENGKVG